MTPQAAARAFDRTVIAARGRKVGTRTPGAARIDQGAPDGAGRDLSHVNQPVQTARRPALGATHRTPQAAAAALNFPLEYYGPAERQRHGGDLVNFLAALRCALRCAVRGC